MIGDKTFYDDKLNKVSKVPYKAYSEGGLMLAQVSDDRKSVEFYNNFDFKKQTGEPGSKKPVESLTFPDGMVEIVYLPEIY